jgi:hypothetical protein
MAKTEDRRWQTGRRKMRAACRKSGMEWGNFLSLVKEIGWPGARNKLRWIADAKAISSSVSGVPKAFDWAAFLAVIVPIIEEMLDKCMKS